MLFIPGVGKTQPIGFISVQKTNLSDISLVSSNYYDGKSLWGYMNGGADLYLEYGFEGLLVQEIKLKGNSIKCEIYKMADPLSAFGIFSVQSHNCKTNPGFSSPHCINNYQVQVVKGEYYLSIINSGGTLPEQEASIELGKQFDLMIESIEIPFPGHPLFRQNAHKLKYLEGEISLSNVYPQALKYLGEVSGYTLWILPMAEKKSPVVSIIQFKNQEELKRYAALAFSSIDFKHTVSRKLKKGVSLTARKVDDNTVIQAEGIIGKELKKILEFD
jgi:hypothetical protein